VNATQAAKGTDHVDTAPLEEDDEALLARFEKEGVVRRGQGGPIPAELLLPGPKCWHVSVLDALIEERRSGR
jgi:hypothetical protein